MDLFASSPLRAPPLIPAVCLLGDSLSDTFRNIRRLERPPLPRYQLARDLVRVLAAGRQIDWALGQARASLDFQQRDYAKQVLEAFQTQPSLLQRWRGMELLAAGEAYWELDHQFQSAIEPNFRLRSKDDDILVFLHFWTTPLTPLQLRVICSLMRRWLWTLPGYAGIGIEIVTAPKIEALKSRRLQVKLVVSDGHGYEDIHSFEASLRHAWAEYHKAHPSRAWT